MENNRRQIQASDITVETYADYCDWLWEIIDKSNMRNLSASINEIEKLEITFSEILKSCLVTYHCFTRNTDRQLMYWLRVFK